MQLGAAIRHPLTVAAAVATAWCDGALGAGIMLTQHTAPYMALGSFVWLGFGLVAFTAIALANRSRVWAVVGLSLPILVSLPFLVAVSAAGLLWLVWKKWPRPQLLTLGYTRWGQPIALRAEDRLLHCHVLGPTGSGKSTAVLLPWMRQDIVSGRPFSLIEPKGDLSETVARFALSHGHTIIPFDPTQHDCPHWNPLEGDLAAAGEGLALALDQWDTGSPSFYRTISRVLLVQIVMAVKTALGDHADLESVLRALRDPGFRHRVIRDCHNPAIEAYFQQEFGALSASRQQELQIGLVNKLKSLLLYPGLARAFSPPFDFSLSEVLTSGLYLLAPLKSAQLGLGAQVTGTLLWHLLIQAVYQRGPASELLHTLYLDEFHQYVSQDLSEVLALVRGYGMSMVLAHQDMAQLDANLAAAVIANARTRLILGGANADDILRFRHQAHPFLLPDPRYLRRGWAVVTPTVGGRLHRPRLVRLPRPASRKMYGS